MKVNRRGTPFAMLAATVVAALAMIHCSSSGSPTPPATSTPAAVTLASISLSTSSVVGGKSVTGTAFLSAIAPAGGAAVSLTGGASPVVTMPASITVPAGSTSTTFTISTVVVAAATSATISASYGGLSASAVLTVMPVVATALFGVTGPVATETCTLASNVMLNCVFDGSGSTAAGGQTITAYDWSYGVAGSGTLPQMTSSPVLMNPPFNCTLMPPPPLPAGTAAFTMTVTLPIHDSNGNTASATNNEVRLQPQGACGF
jgi:hypothetical protein